ncbi:hypothetical protein [Luteibaculum oceani]|uniref:Uncharacterized protein n=1 Tax=Luteibaculum oceani TaxID=1294296 RepID=A0A5C6V0T2_9FLAO|nr:hypothetical protein [Luteibaculum oceani]TXC78779.1 hypothetical protein FRX97_06060 [Luteibaculum oceani]
MLGLLIIGGFILLLVGVAQVVNRNEESKGNGSFISDEQMKSKYGGLLRDLELPFSSVLNSVQVKREYIRARYRDQLGYPIRLDLKHVNEKIYIALQYLDVAENERIIDFTFNKTDSLKKIYQDITKRYLDNMSATA